MSNYNRIELSVYKFLESFPLFRNIAKKSYSRLNYLFYVKRNFKYHIHPDAKIYTPCQWIGGEDKNCGGDLFFGYYDKSPWSMDMKILLFHRICKKKGNIELLIFNRKNKQIYKIANSSAWNFQQGCMTQWMPCNDKHRIIFNDIEGRNLVSRIVNLENKSEILIPCPIQVIHPSGEQALTLNYKRLERLRPDYGYKPRAENFSEFQTAEKDGIWLVDLINKTTKLKLTLSELMKNQPKVEMRNAQHKINHIFYSPNGSKFIFLHRWIRKSGKYSRLYVSNSDFSNLRLLMDERMISHYSWENDERIIAFARTEKGDRYYLINVINGETKIIGKGILDKYGDGHPSFSPDKEWILTDTYPDRARQRYLLLFNRVNKNFIELGRFFSPWAYEGIRRCDLHPRWSPDGKMISFDSSHEGRRFTYILEVSNLLKNNAI